MRLNRLDLNLLVALDALLTERSITRAAMRIHLSQPATSGALARLREYFGDELLVRVGSEMRPTPLGESLVNPVHKILMQIQATVERGVEFIPEESERKFKLLLSDYISTTLMAPIIRKLAKVAPGVQLEFFMPTSDPAYELEQGNIDFLVMPEFTLSQEHPSKIIYQDKFVCLTWNENREITDTLTLEQYKTLGHVTVLFGVNRAQTQDQVLLKEEYNLVPNVEIITSSFNAIPQFLVETNRIATIYERLAETWCNYLPLTMYPVPVSLPPVEWSLQWHQYRDLDPGIIWMKEFITNVGAEISDT